MLGRSLGIFKAEVDVNADAELLKMLEHGRKRAAGLLTEEEEKEDDAEKLKPN